MKREQRGPSAAPDTEAMAELLAERYPIAPGERLRVRAELEPLPGLVLSLETRQGLYRISVGYLRGAGASDRWDVLTDALDALFGSFMESERAYRELPQGDEVEYQGAFFRVSAEREVPELARRADQLLERGASGLDPED